MGAISGVTPTLAVRSGLSFLDSYQFSTSVEPFTPVLRDTPSPRPPAYATTMLAPTVVQESSLSHNEFALCLQSLLRPSSALSACEFATCMRALIPSPVPACLPSLPRPSSALSPSEFESLYMRALTPTHVPVGFRQSGSRPRQPAWPITGVTTRVFRRPFLMPTPRVIEYSDDVVFLFHPPHLSYEPACPSPWQFYDDCNCRERVDCRVHVTGESKSVDPVWNTQASHSQMSLNSSQTGQQHQAQ